MRFRDVWTAVGLTAVALAVAGAVGAGGWPGEPSGCIAAADCYCEAFTGGLVEQPVNTFSNLGFIAVGLWVLGGTHLSSPGRLAVDATFRRLYGGVAVFLGIGSMLFHGTMTEWGGWADLLSMHFFITFFLFYELMMLTSRGKAWFLQTYAVTNLVLAVALWVMDNGYGKFVFAGFIIATLIANRMVVAGGRVIREARWFWAGLGTYLGGNVVWLLSRTGAAWCDPDSLLQGHSLWHMTSAVAVAFFFKYLASERSPAVADSQIAASAVDRDL